MMRPSVLFCILWVSGPTLALYGCSNTPCAVTAQASAELYIGSAIGYSARDIQPTDDGGFIIAGATAAEVSGPYEDALLVKTDSAGRPQWARAYGSDDLDDARSVQLAGDGGYLVVGNTGGPVWEPGGLMQLGVDMQVFKVDAAGDEVWSRTVSLDTFTIAYGACVNPDGSFVVAGSSGQRLPGDRGALLVKMDGEGNEMWRRQLLGSAALTAKAVIATVDAGHALTGYSETSTPNPRKWDLYVAKLDANGSKVWDFWGGDTLKFSGDRLGEAIVQTQDGGYAIVATAYDGNAGQLFVAKLDAEGGLQWANAAPGLPYGAGFALVEAADGSLVAAGSSYSLDLFVACIRFFGARFSEAGSVLWTGIFDGRSGEEAYSITQNADGDFVLVGGDNYLSANSAIHLVTTNAGR